MDFLLLIGGLIGFGLLIARQTELGDRLAAAEAALDELRRSGAPPGADPAITAAEAESGQPKPSPWSLGPEPADWHDPPAEEAAPDIPEEERETFGALFERLVGGRLLIWLGGAALIVAAFFLIRYSIEIGLLTPQARMAGAAVFGLIVVAAGEHARTGRWLADDPRVSQALVGAGIVILYATPYGSHVLYALIDARTASLVMLLVTAGALFLSLRHGAPTAVMGLIGGFLTPLLVGDPDAGAVPLLAYLTMLNAGLFVLAWARGWSWLAAAAVLLSFLWTLSLLGSPPRDALASGFFIAALALAASLLRPGGGRAMALIQPAAIGLVELALLVARADLGLAAWAMFGALAASSLFLSLLRPEQRFAPPVALTLALFLLAVRAAPGNEPHLPFIAAAITALFAGFSLPLALRGERLLRTAMSCAAFAGPSLILRAVQPELLGRGWWGLLLLTLAAGPALLAWLTRAHAKEEAPDRGLFLCAATAALLLGTAVYDLFWREAVAAGWIGVALLVAFWGARVRESGFALVALAAAAAGVFRAATEVAPLWSSALASLYGDPVWVTDLPSPLGVFWALALPAALLLALWKIVRKPPAPSRRALPAAAGLFLLAAAYVLAKQVFAISSPEDFEMRGFAERTAITQALFLTGWLLARSGGRLPALGDEEAARIGNLVTFAAALRLIWFDMLIHSPLLVAQQVGEWPVLNLLLPAYLLSAYWLYEARRRADERTRSGFWLAAFLASAGYGVMLMVRQLFQGSLLSDFDLPTGEFYSYSLAGLLLSIALLVGGIAARDKALRLAGLAFLTATILKVFLIDASALTGVLRILSFLGLGIALIGVGRLYGVVLRAQTRPSAEAPAGAL